MTTSLLDATLSTIEDKCYCKGHTSHLSEWQETRQWQEMLSPISRMQFILLSYWNSMQILPNVILWNVKEGCTTVKRRKFGKVVEWSIQSCLFCTTFCLTQEDDMQIGEHMLASHRAEESRSLYTEPWLLGNVPDLYGICKNCGFLAKIVVFCVGDNTEAGCQ